MSRGAREVEDLAAELRALERVFEAELEGALGDADGAGGGLDAGAFEGRHQVLEAEALDFAEQVAGRHFEAVEAELVFLHAAIAEHFDLAAGHAFGGEGVLVRAARLLADEHREAGEVVGVRDRAGEDRHRGRRGRRA